MKKFILFGIVALLTITINAQDSFEDKNGLFVGATLNTVQGDWGDFYDLSYSLRVGYRINHSETFDYGFSGEYIRIIDNDPFPGEGFLALKLDAYLAADILNNVDGEVYGGIGYSFATAENANYSGLYLDAGYNFRICESFSAGPRTSIILDDPNLCTLGLAGTFTF